ncbi:DUF3995 domain-containing protein [Paenibacillus alvei]|uniref:DUF3995 domain-containing protein n=1 Tax=Paenibacillus alvei TaxID=44250 RepID=UPI0035587AD8
MLSAISFIAACMLFVISLLHVYWAFHGTWGKGAVIPERDGKQVFSPHSGMTLLIAALLAFAGVILLVRASFLPSFIDSSIIQWGAWVCACIFALRVIGEFNYVGLFKKNRSTTFSKMDTCLYIPLCAFLSFAFILSILYGVS